MEHVQEVIRLVLKTADNGQFYFEISMIMDCGIQLTLLSSLAFKLHNLMPQRSERALSFT